MIHLQRLAVLVGLYCVVSLICATVLVVARLAEPWTAYPLMFLLNLIFMMMLNITHEVQLEQELKPRRPRGGLVPRDEVPALLSRPEHLIDGHLCNDGKLTSGATCPWCARRKGNV